jgi:rhodanese-related sulfurtransferase
MRRIILAPVMGSLASGLMALLFVEVPAAATGPTTVSDVATALCAGATVTLEQDIDQDSAVLTVAGGCIATLDLNGHALSVSRVELGQGADLTIRDTSASADGELVAEGKAKPKDAPPEKPFAQIFAEDARFEARREAQKKTMEAARDALRESETRAREAREEHARKNPSPVPLPVDPELEPEPTPPPFHRDWALVSAAECFDAFKNGNVPVVDVRGARDFQKEAVVGSTNVPSVSITGRPLHWKKTALGDAFIDAFVAKFPDVDAELVVLGSEGSETDPDGAAVVLGMLRDAGFWYRNAAEAAGGYENWVKQYTPAGKKRTGNAKYTNVVGAPGTICAFSEIITQEDGVFEDLMKTTYKMRSG